MKSIVQWPMIHRRFANSNPILAARDDIYIIGRLNREVKHLMLFEIISVISGANNLNRI